VKLFQAAECIHLAYTEFNDLFEEYLSVTMSSTAPNVDAWLNFHANQPSNPSQKKLKKYKIAKSTLLE
jgi:hypothetical protein